MPPLPWYNGVEEHCHLLKEAYCVGDEKAWYPEAYLAPEPLPEGTCCWGESCQSLKEAYCTPHGGDWTAPSEDAPPSE